MKNVLKLNGLECANCAAKIEEATKKINGVQNLSVSFFSAKMVFECQEELKEIIIEEIKKIIKKLEPDVKIELV